MSSTYNGEGAFRTVVTEFLVFSRIARSLRFGVGVWYGNWVYVVSHIQFRTSSLILQNAVYSTMLAP
jgi:hypothetical protein